MEDVAEGASPKLEEQPKMTAWRADKKSREVRLLGSWVQSPSGALIKTEAVDARMGITGLCHEKRPIGLIHDKLKLRHPADRRAQCKRTQSVPRTTIQVSRFFGALACATTNLYR
jgi:hypothetical protein